MPWGRAAKSAARRPVSRWKSDRPSLEVEGSVMARSSFALAMLLVSQAWPALAQDRPGGAQSRYGKQLAVIVGINYGGSNNKEVLQPLLNAERDAEAVAKRLKEL